tara:strand:+ start:191310 stop:191591 length:282 start_codon:yes stop_codon:yes gene_type:complete
MKSNKLSTVVLVFGLTLITNLTFGQPQKSKDQKQPPTFSELLEKMDANTDSKLSLDEVKGELQKHFTKIDTDEDGFITKAEFEKAPKPKKRDK